ncbi:MAG: ATP-binding cassette domain-containing protein, partial [Oscillospiraceae bacterium]|nr:ATP-binding cassette domain-containing protein [Oscillospiraceae bacterium]
MEILRAEDIKYAYAAEENAWNFALDGVSLTVNSGEFVVIVGHNGSGKSTF